MVSIDFLLVKQFRGIIEQKFYPKSINILVGANNTGKSSILQALTLGVCSQSKFIDSFNLNILNYLLNVKKYQLKSLGRKNKASIEFSFQDNKEEINIEYFKDDLPSDKRRYIIFNYIENMKSIYLKKRLAGEYRRISFNRSKIQRSITEFFDKSGEEKREDEISIIKQFEESIIQQAEKVFNEKIANYLKSEKILITTYSNNELDRIFLIPSIKVETDYSRYENKENSLFTTIEIHEKKNYEEDSFTFCFVSSITHLLKDLYYLHDLVLKEGKLEKVLSKICENIPYFIDLRRTKESLYVLQKGIKIPLSVNSMGDGFISLLSHLFYIALAEDGILVLEEPETSSHPGFLEILAEVIVINSKNTQFFISTHSMDLVQFLLEESNKRDLLDNVNIYRFHSQGEKQTAIEVLNGNSAFEEVDNIQSDLRGP